MPGHTSTSGRTDWRRGVLPRPSSLIIPPSAVDPQGLERFAAILAAMIPDWDVVAVVDRAFHRIAGRTAGADVEDAVRARGPRSPSRPAVTIGAKAGQVVQKAVLLHSDQCT